MFYFFTYRKRQTTKIQKTKAEKIGEMDVFEELSYLSLSYIIYN